MAARPRSGASTPRPPTWRTTGRSSCGRTAATSWRPTTRPPCSTPTRRRAASSSCRTSSGRTRSCPIRPCRRRRATPSSRARRRWPRTAHGRWPRSTQTGSPAVGARPSGPAGRFTSVNPTGAVVYKGSKAPDAAWEFAKYLASPPAQQQLMTLKASIPVNKEVLAGPYSSSWDGAKVFADSLTYAKLKPSFKGYDEFTTTLQNELDTNVFNAANKTAKDALATVVPQLNQILAAQ